MPTEQRRPPRPLPLFEGPRLLVVTEKHGSYYYFVQNEAVLHAAALAIVKRRFEEGYWYGREEDFETGFDKAAYLEEKTRIETLQDKEIRNAALKAHAAKLETVKWEQKGRDHFLMAKKAVERGDGSLAWLLLQDRSGHEYEHVELERVVLNEPLCARPENPKHGQHWVDSEGKRWVYDAKTIKDWIPHLYAGLLYDVEAFQGKEIARREWSEIDAYAKT